MRRLVIYLLFAFSGLAALVYEVMWMRGFRVVFGSSTRSAAVVLAAYFGGMALGSLIGASLAKRGRPLRLYGLAEICVGLSALLVGPWLAAYASVYPDLYAWTDGRPSQLLAAKWLLAFLAMGPPTLAMGISLPLVARAVVTHSGHVARRTGLLYALNVLGATAGALLAGFFLPVAVGVPSSVWLAVGMNLAVGVGALLLTEEAASPAGEIVLEPPDASCRTATTSAPLLVTAAAVSGFGTLALEVVYLRLLSQVSENSVYSFGAMLSLFLLFLAAGSLVVACWLDRVNPWRFLAWTQLAAVPAILVSALLYTQTPAIGLFAAHDTLGQRLVKMVLATLPVLGPPVLLTGVVLPATWKIAARSGWDIGRGVGVLTAANTLAAVCGSLATGFFLLPLLGLGGSTVVVASLYATLAAAAFHRGYKGIARYGGGIAALAIVVAWHLAGFASLATQPLLPGETLVSYHDGETAAVAVVQRSDGHRMLRMNHDYLLGSSVAADREIRQGRLPMLLHCHARTIGFIGIATGMTASAALDFPVQQVVAMELVPGVVDALPSFTRWNRSFFKDPRVEIVVADGRNHLLGTARRFDVIVGDLFVPWHAGTGDLYTVEHFKVVRQRLAPDGLFVQWLPMYQLSSDQMRSITASLAAVFPAITLWRCDFDSVQPLWALVAYRDKLVFNAEGLQTRCRRLAAATPSADPLLADVESIALLYLCGDTALRRWAAEVPINSDRRPIVEFSSPATARRDAYELLAEHHVLLESLRPRTWAYTDVPQMGRPIEQVMQTADSIADANAARRNHNFESEFRLAKRLAEDSGDVYAVAGFVMDVASRYRARHMTSRSDQLLEELANCESPPVAVLVALASSKRVEGEQAEAIELLERAVRRAPSRLGIRLQLTELHAAAEHYAEAESHLRHIVLARPNDHRQRLLLAHLLDKQEKRKEAAEQIEQFRERWDGSDHKDIWLYLRSLHLGQYFDAEEPSP